MIRPLSLVDISSYLKGRLSSGVTGESDAGKVITGISIDSRTIARDELFIAINGLHLDGHQYLKQAQQSGAIAAVVESISEDVTMPQILVDDTFHALGQLGQMNRSDFDGTVVAVTGSCGKTSVKEMLSAILSERSKVLATSGNLNNGYGVPLTLFKLKAEHDNAVIELGTSSPGEIQYIADLTKPDISIITNAAEAHLEELKSVQGVATEKGFIIDALGEEGIAILNRGDAFFSQWCERALKVSGRKVFSFSLKNTDADCYAENIQLADEGMRFDLLVHGERRSVNLSFWGRHQVANACCAALACSAANIDLDTIVQGLENARPLLRRGLRYQLPSTNRSGSNVTVYDETYNANPKATLAAIDLLSDCLGKRVMVFGDMLELGEQSPELHKGIGRHAKQQGIEYFAGFGVQARLACDAYGKEGRHFDTKEALIVWVESLVKNESGGNLSVLVKGSRGMEMLDVVRSLVGSNYKGER